MDERTRRNVVAMGTVSFFADIAGEMVAPILPLFIVSTLGAPPLAVGLVDGAADLTASACRALGGWWTDRARRRKPTVLFGYAVSALAKPVLALAGAWPVAMAARMLDRSGKGLRGSARDALITDSVDKSELGYAFGLHRAMDTAGAVLGPLCALALISRGFDHRRIFELAALPAAASVLIVAAFVREARRPDAGSAAARAGAPGARTPLPRAFWAFLSVYGLFALGNSSDSFLLLKARADGLSETRVILAYVLFNLVNAALAPAMGRLADRWGRRRVVASGLLVFALCYAGFAADREPRRLWGLFALYGVYAALVEGSFRAVVSQFTDEGNRGTAHGVFQSLTGALAFCASVLAGVLWTRVGPAAPFVFGAACAALASAGLAAAARAA